MDKYTACFGREEIKWFTPPENSVLVSITDPSSHIALVVSEWDAVLRLQFWDVEKTLTMDRWDDVKDVREFEKIEPATEEQIRLIHMFIQSHHDKNIFAHCEAGVSRSAAVREYLIRRGWKYYMNNGERAVYPNGYILSHLERLDYPHRDYNE